MRRWKLCGLVTAAEEDPFPATALPVGPGRPFGWYLDVDGTAVGGDRAVYFSEGQLNALHRDRLFSYRLGPLRLWVDRGAGAERLDFGEAYLLAWEDMPWTGRALGDDDYDDMMYVVGRVTSVAALR